MLAVLRRMLIPGQVGVVAVHPPAKRLPDIVGQLLLVVLDCQKVVASASDNLSSDLILAGDGIDRHQGSLQFLQFQQLRYRCDFVGFAVHWHLGQAERMLGGPGTDQIQRSEVGRAGATDTFAVQADVIQAEDPANGLHSAAETAGEGSGIEPSEGAFEVVVDGGTGQVGQLSLQPGEAFFGEGGDGLPVVGPCDDGTDGDEEDVGEEVLSAVLSAWIAQGSEVLGHRDGRSGHETVLHERCVRFHRMAGRLTRSTLT